MQLETHVKYKYGINSKTIDVVFKKEQKNIQITNELCGGDPVVGTKKFLYDENMNILCAEYDYVSIVKNTKILDNIMKINGFVLNRPLSSVHKKNFLLGIAISTHNRYTIFKKTFETIKKNTSYLNTKIVVVDDCSDFIVPEANFRFDVNVGISRTKNKCLELLEDCDYVFLFDDDIFPIVDNWYSYYIDSGYNHLCYIFGDGISGHKKTKLYEKDNISYYNSANGCMMFFTRNVINTLGEFNNKYGKYGNEHLDYSLRCYKAKLIPYPYIDLSYSNKIFYSYDYNNNIISSVNDNLKNNITKIDMQNLQIYHKN